MLIVLGFNNTSTLVGHFVSSPRGREKRDRRDSRGDKREGQERGTGVKVKEQKRLKQSPLPLPATRIEGLAQLEAIISWIPR